MDAASLLAGLRGEGHNLWLRNGRLVIAPPPPQRLWSAIREGKEALLVLLAADHEPRPTPPAPPPPGAALPATAPGPETPPARPLTKSGALLGDPPVPVVDPEAAHTLVILELAGAQPGMRPHGQLGLAHPERASADLRAAAQLHQGDIAALLGYRALLEQLWPVTAELPAGTEGLPDG